MSVADEKQAANVLQDLCALLQKGGFKLKKWMSTSKVVLRLIPEENRSTITQNAIPSFIRTCVLGVNWCVATDEFFFSISIPDCVITKRKILSVTNSLYDPLGFVLPVILRARLIYSDVCKAKFDWDKNLTGTHLKRFESWTKGLGSLQDIRVPRCFKGTVIGLFQLQLHFFSDASNVARGSVCYARIITPDSMPFCRLIMAKSHIAGSGQNTIPCLELEAALDAVKLATLVKKEMELSNVPCFFGPIPPSFCKACEQT